MVSAGERHTVLLRSDGCAVAIRDNSLGQCDIPPLDEGNAYTQVSAGARHTVLLQSDGCAVAIGCNSLGQCNIPALDEKTTYTQIWVYVIPSSKAGMLHCPDELHRMATTLPSLRRSTVA